MKSKAIILNYEGNEITFGVGEDVWINATEMSKMFDKQARDFLKTAQTQEYIKIYSTKTKILLTDIVKVVNGGVHNGTWMRRKLALRFAQWLSAEFAFWVDEQIEKLLTTGKVEIKPSSEVTLPNFADPVAAARAWADKEEARLIAEAKMEQEKAEKEIAQKQLAEAKPKAEFHDNVVATDDLMSVNAAAKILNTGEYRLFAALRTAKILFSDYTMRNLPYQKYIDSGYFKVKESIKDEIINRTTWVTQRGLDAMFKWKKDGKLPATIFNDIPTKELVVIS